MNNIPLSGEGVRLAWKLGAVPDGMGLMLTTYADALPFPRSAKSAPLWDLIMFSFPYLWVNRRGERFVDEGSMNGAYMANAVARQKDGAYFMIIDHDIKEMLRTEGPDIWGYLSDDLLLDLDELFDYVVEKGADNFYRADSIEALAEQMDVPVEALKQTVAQYNEDCHRGHDSLFAKDRKFLRPVETPRFYAIRHMNSGYGSVGGSKSTARHGPSARTLSLSRVSMPPGTAPTAPSATIPP